MHDETVEVMVGEGKTQIPVRNLWLLYLYASELYRHLDADERITAERAPEQLPALAARILCMEVEKRLHGELTYGYVQRHDVLTAVRDRLDILGTERGQLLQRGRVMCSYEELTVDTSRNRYVAAALNVASRQLTACSKGLRQRCASLVTALSRRGVHVAVPDSRTPRLEVYGHFDHHDRRMMAAAQIVVELLMPSHAPGTSHLRTLDTDHRTLRKLYEHGLRGFYAVNIPGASVGPRELQWLAEPGDDLFPKMRTDITLTGGGLGREVVIECKFTEALSAETPKHPRRFHTNHLYQLYAYLRTQEVDGSSDPRAAGILLYPATNSVPLVDSHTAIQRHPFTVATVDLRQDPEQVRQRLLALVSQAATVEAAAKLPEDEHHPN